MPKLTKREIDGMPLPEGKEVVIWDDDIPGFGLRAKPSGTRSFLVQYRNKHGVSRRLTLGRYGILTAEQARDLARRTLASVALGSDPAQERDEDRSAWTIRKLCEDYLREAEAGNIIGKRGQPKRRSTLAIDKGRIARHILPLLGPRIVQDLKGKDILRFLRDVNVGKTAADVKTGARGRAIVRGGPVAAKRCVGLLQGILSHAVSMGVIETNPAHGLRLPADAKRRVSGLPEKFAALGRALQMGRDDGVPWQATGAVELAALTGMRRSEAMMLRWAEVDLVSRVLHLHDSKTGESVRPLGRAAVDLLKRIKAQNHPGGYVFPAQRKHEGSFGGLPKAFLRVISNPKLGQEDRTALQGFTLHSLRHAFATTANNLGLTTPTVAALLGHAAGGVTAGYISNVDSVLMAAADKVAAEVALMMGNRQTAAIEEHRVRSSDA